MGWSLLPWCAHASGVIPFLFRLPCVLGIIFGFVVIALFILAVVVLAIFNSAVHGASAPPL
jgi:hypothetical protein